MKKQINKKLLFLITFLLMGIIFAVYVTYAYYAAEIVGNESASTVAVTGGVLSINYQNNSANIVAEKIMPGWSATKNFTVTATVDYNGEYETNFNIWYDMLLIVERNDFLTGSLEYLLEPIESDAAKEGIFLYDKYRGVPTGTSLEGVLMGSGRLQDDTASHTYNLTLRYIDRDDVDQTSEMEGKFYARVNLRGSQKQMIILDLDGGEIAGNDIYYAIKGETITLPTPKKYNYIFSGWTITNGEENGSVDGNNVTINGEVLYLKAVWRYKSVDSVLVLNLDGGTSTQDTINNIKTYEIQTLEAPTKSGYLFRGWGLVMGDADISGNKLIAYDENVEIIALWESVVPDFTYTGEYLVYNDTEDDWRIKFLTSGTLTFSRLGNAESGIDVFVVGGGGGGAGYNYEYYGTPGDHRGGGSGSGGYSSVGKVPVLALNQGYTITVGSGGTGGNTESFQGGYGGASSAFQVSASGGAPITNDQDYTFRSAGTDRTVYEFKGRRGTKYGAAGKVRTNAASTSNSGNGGNGGGGDYHNGYTGGSGIVIIRNVRG